MWEWGDEKKYDIYADGAKLIEKIHNLDTDEMIYVFTDGCCTLEWTTFVEGSLNVGDSFYIEGKILDRNKTSLKIRLDTFLPIDKLYF